MEACRTRVVHGEVVGKPCDDCGHIKLLHPGVSNPELEECLVCQIEVKLGELDD